MKTTTKARLDKKESDNILETELRISVKTLVLIIFIVFVFFALCFIAVPQTYGLL